MRHRRWPLLLVAVLLGALPAEAADVRGTVTSIERDSMLIDIGRTSGLAVGDGGEVFYEIRLGSTRRENTMASIKIEEVFETTARARVVVRKSDAPIGAGYLVKVSIRDRSAEEAAARDRERAEQERRRAEDDRRAAEQLRRQAEEERRRLEEDRRRQAEEDRRRQAEDERRRRPGPAAIVPREERGMMWVEGGAFGFGADDSDPDAADVERPQREVQVRGFWIDKLEVTNELYARFVEDGGYRRRELWSPEGWAWRERGRAAGPRYQGDSRWNDAVQPVVGVSWHEAQAFCRWSGKRLPREPEWEMAARGFDNRKYPWGNRWERDRASTAQGGIDRPRPTGQFPKGASPFGVLDMAGNVAEWTDAPFRPYTDAAAADAGPAEMRAIRGGGWHSNPHDVRVTSRKGQPPDYQGNGVGFRCARD